MAERLWAPWRLRYIERKDGPPGCFFVELPKQDDDRGNLILFRGETAFVMLNAFPYTNGHLMIAPYRHTADIEGMSDPELLEINRLVARACGWIRKTYGPDGFNVGVNLGAAAGAGVPDHVHWHVVPRWSGDTNFMTTVGDVRVMPEDLTATYDRLRRTIEEEAT